MTSTISKAHRDGQNNYLHPLKMLQAIKKSNIGIKDLLLRIIIYHTIIYILSLYLMYIIYPNIYIIYKYNIY